MVNTNDLVGTAIGAVLAVKLIEVGTKALDVNIMDKRKKKGRRSSGNSYKLF